MALACFVQIFNHCVETQQEWPQAFQWARVVLPGKTSEPNQIKDGRPINILGLLYRLSMKCIAREVLMHLSFKLPPSIVGGLPKRDGSILWYHSQHLIEQALTKGDPLHGCVTDLQKFFNGIPRPFLRQLMIRFGLPECLVESWLALLGTLKRAVVVQEGVPLSGAHVEYFAIAHADRRQEVEMSSSSTAWRGVTEPLWRRRCGCQC